jgi:hypothetical protein
MKISISAAFRRGRVMSAPLGSLIASCRILYKVIQVSHEMGQHDLFFGGKQNFLERLQPEAYLLRIDFMAFSFSPRTKRLSTRYENS